MFEIIVGAIIGLFISYFIIKGAVKAAIEENMEPYLKMQNAFLRHLAKQAGMEEWQIDKIWMTEKKYKKKYQEKN